MPRSARVSSEPVYQAAELKRGLLDHFNRDGVIDEIEQRLLFQAEELLRGVNTTDMTVHMALLGLGAAMGVFSTWWDRVLRTYQRDAGQWSVLLGGRDDDEGTAA